MLHLEIAMASATVSRGSATHFECSEGAASLSQSGRTVLIKMVGRVDAAVGRSIAAALDEVLEKSPEPLSTFWDLEGMEHYHSDVRVLCTKALLRNWSKVIGIQTLATNRIVKMGVAVANVALRGRLRNTESRAEFEALCRAAR
jgi:hypothetical protein